MSTAFHTTRRVEFGETDMAGIVHFSNFFRYMEAAETAFLRARGLSVSLQWQGESVGFPRVSVACDYLKPAKFEDLLDIFVTLEKIGRKSLTFAFDFKRGDEVLAQGRITSVFCRKLGDQGMESLEIPDELRRILEVG